MNYNLGANTTKVLFFLIKIRVLPPTTKCMLVFFVKILFTRISMHLNEKKTLGALWENWVSGSQGYPKHALIMLTFMV